MRVKTKGFLTGAVFVLFMALLVLLAVITDEPTTASAATTTTQTAIFSYTYHLDNADNDLSENNVNKSQEIRSSDGGKKCEIAFQLNTDIVTNSDNEIWVNNVGIKSLQVRAKSNFNVVGFEVKNSFGETIYSCPINFCNVTLDDGEYSIIYKGFSTWTENVGEQREIISADIECTIKICVDTTPPIMESSLNTFEEDTNTGFIVIVKDINKPKLYYKKPNMVTFECAQSESLSISQNSIEGKYYFYAVDSVGNRTATRWINLIDTNIDCEMIQSEYDNSVYFLWEGDDLVATLDGKPYEKSMWIKSEGDHILRLCNGSGKEKIYSFSIDHCYKLRESTSPTCTIDGRCVYVCVQCNQSYEETLTAIGHKYTVTTIPSTCTANGYMILTCSVCNSKIEKAGDYPTGHNYITEVLKAPTCTVDGLRCSTCEICGDIFETKIIANGHNYNITESSSSNGKITRTYTCTICGDSYKQELGDQYEEVTNYIEYLFEQYEPYMWWVLLASAGVWSIIIGVMIAIAQKNEEKEKAKKMLINYVIGLVVIAVIVVACPFLIRGIAALVT